MKCFLLLGSLNAFLAVILGAFAAHGLKPGISPAMLDIFNTGVQYHMYHAIGLLLVGLLISVLPVTGWIKWSGWLMVAGIIMFSGSLYLLAMGLPRSLGVLTPIGGLAFLLAWICLIVAIIKTGALSS